MTVRINNTAVTVDFWFAAVLVFLLLFFPSGNAAMCFLFCVLHELGHLAAMIAFKSVPTEIRLGFFGMRIVTGGRLLKSAGEIITAAAGPFVNFLLAAALFIMKKNEAAILSLGLGIFNMLPVSMLDGGRVLLTFHKNKKAAEITDYFCCFLLLLTGIAVAVYTRRNFTVLTVALYLTVGCLT